MDDTQKTNTSPITEVNQTVPLSSTDDNAKKSQTGNLFAHPLKRVLALFIDSFVLGAFGLVLGLFFNNVFYSLGQNGWWIGFIISVLYFSLFQTTRKGQTFGAKLVGIAVVSTDGKYLTIGNALLRNFLLEIILLNSNIGALIPLSNHILTYIYGAIIFSYMISVIVFILFHPQHRGLHDLLSGSVVVNNKGFQELKTSESLILSQKDSNKNPLVISVVLSLLVCIIGLYTAIILPSTLFKQNGMTDMLNISEAINKDPGVQNSTISLNEFFSGNNQPTTTLLITVQVDRKIFLNKNLLDSLEWAIKAQTVKLYPNINKVSQIEVIFNSSYSIGIWSFHETISGTPTSPKQIHY